MAKILLIAINDCFAEGLRSLSASLKAKGHQPCIAFIKQFTLRSKKKIEKDDWVSINDRGEKVRNATDTEITATEKENLLALISNIQPLLIGISVTTPVRRRAAEITMLCKKNFSIPIIWGGPDPTISPEDCLVYCDFVCIGEGESVIVDIASALEKNNDVSSINNLAYLADNRLVRNPLNPLITNLDILPFKDIDPNNKFLLEENSLVKSYDPFRLSVDTPYFVMSSRGCPYSCSYCCESFYRKLYDKEVFLRRRSPAHVVAELREAKKSIDFRFVAFGDEVFSYDYSWLMEFKSMYAREINCEFVCNIYPTKDIERRLKIMKDLGLVYACLALQSGSERIQREVFNRVFDRELYIKTANMLHSMGIKFYVDIITFNPAEDEKDLQDTLSVLKNLPRPFEMNVNKLFILKGTKIHELAKKYIESRQMKLAPESLFIYYSRLFLLTTKYHKIVVTAIEKIRVFNYSPFLFYFFYIIKKIILYPRRILYKVKRLYKIKVL
ncbi:MAG: radical SAM protein [Candidatus Omnitrophica bacterium]|nr:radical SAM protein [Candidatus Omnitrophota bacterium]